MAIVGTPGKGVYQGEGALEFCGMGCEVTVGTPEGGRVALYVLTADP